ncbi:hypothetical protein [Tessaracoccus massiliensis]|uniref:hypothetical protein n=1 Tax=Tessaracoccus massiliensis TaxID=1522311 RepID=UPI00058FE117|nr:hypothetical protein [Tessaracoccus massiliensis]
MEQSRTVVTVDAPQEALFPGSALIGTILFPIFAIAALVLGLAYEMAWLVTSSLAIGLALLAILASDYLNKQGRSGKLRLAVGGGDTRIGSNPSSRWVMLIATALAAVVVLVDIVLRLMGYLDDPGGMSFSVMVALVVVWGIAEGWFRLTKPPGLVLSPSHVTTIGSMGKETRVPWNQVNGAACIKGARLLIPALKDELQVATAQIDSDPRVVAALIEAYRNRPARQAELGDGRVVQRAQSLSVG